MSWLDQTKHTGQRDGSVDYSTRNIYEKKFTTTRNIYEKKFITRNIYEKKFTTLSKWSQWPVLVFCRPLTCFEDFKQNDLN